LLAPTDKVEITEEQAKEEAKNEPKITKDGGLNVTSDEGVKFLEGKINEILGGDAKSLSNNKLELTKVREWATNKGAKSLEDVLWEVRDLANHLGTPGYGESRLKYMYQWIYLSQLRDETTGKMKKMEGFNHASI
jgi:hypothetical protein